MSVCVYFEAGVGGFEHVELQHISSCRILQQQTTQLHHVHNFPGTLTKGGVGHWEFREHVNFPKMASVFPGQASPEHHSQPMFGQ